MASRSRAALLPCRTVLKANGYRTAAFIGGYVLDARFGLNQGFDVYDSPFHLRPDPGEEPPEVKRSADAVLERGRPMDQDAIRASVLRLHPSVRCAPARTRMAATMREIAYVDEAIGRFQQSLAPQKALQDTLIVLTSDHGESLGEHGEETHGYFIYESTLRVPLIFRWPAGAPQYPARVDEPVSLIDVAPSVAGFSGDRCACSVSGPQPDAAVSAAALPTTSPSMAEACMHEITWDAVRLRSVRLGRYKYIEAPKPELYDLERDPGETQNRYEPRPENRTPTANPAESRPHNDRLQRQLPVNPEVDSRLRSLGYLGSGPPGALFGPDPKDRLAEYRRYGRAVRLANSGHLVEAITDFEKATAGKRQEYAGTLLSGGMRIPPGATG